MTPATVERKHSYLHIPLSGDGKHHASVLQFERKSKCIAPILWSHSDTQARATTVRPEPEPGPEPSH
ncbi:hypothetical protein DENSPDRAFT_830907, partial [Dentipellis sp. KUC8613]